MNHTRVIHPLLFALHTVSVEQSAPLTVDQPAGLLPSDQRRAPREEPFVPKAFPITAPVYGDDLDRFYAKVVLGEGDRCNVWTGATGGKGVGERTNAGYGRFFFGGRTVQAHRFVWYATHGDPGPDLQVDHFVCDNTLCVKLEHLRLATPKENTARSLAGRCLVNREPVGRYNRIKTHCPAGHEYSEDNVLLYLGRRTCRRCAREAQRRYKERRRAQRVQAA